MIIPINSFFSISITIISNHHLKILNNLLFFLNLFILITTYFHKLAWISVFYIYHKNTKLQICIPFASIQIKRPQLQKHPFDEMLNFHYRELNTEILLLFLLFCVFMVLSISAFQIRIDLKFKFLVPFSALYR